FDLRARTGRVSDVVAPVVLYPIDRRATGMGRRRRTVEAARHSPCGRAPTSRYPHHFIIDPDHVATRQGPVPVQKIALGIKCRALGELRRRSNGDRGLPCGCYCCTQRRRATVTLRVDDHHGAVIRLRAGATTIVHYIVDDVYTVGTIVINFPPISLI